MKPVPLPPPKQNQLQRARLEEAGCPLYNLLQPEGTILIHKLFLYIISIFIESFREEISVSEEGTV